MSSQRQQATEGNDSSGLEVAKDDGPAVRWRPPLSRQALIVNAFRNASKDKHDDKWKEISAANLRAGEMSSTLRDILQDYELTGDVVKTNPASTQKTVEKTDAGKAIMLLGGKTFERIHDKVFKAQPLTEFSTSNIPEVTASRNSSPQKFSKSEQLNKETKSLRRVSCDLQDLREDDFQKAIWKASAARPSSAFERKLKRIMTVGSDNLPQPLQTDEKNGKDVSRWPTTSSSHYSEFGPHRAHQQTLLIRPKSPNASKVLRDVILPKDRTNLYNEVKDFLLIRLQHLPEGTALSAPDYVTIFFEALGLLSNGLTTYKPLLQTIASELKTVFDVQNQYVKDKQECELAAATMRQKFDIQLQSELGCLKEKLETQSKSDVENMRKRIDDLWDKKESSEKRAAALDLDLRSKSKSCFELSEENAKLKSALQEVIDQNRKIQLVNDDRSMLKEEIRQLRDAVTAMVPKDEILRWKEKELEQEMRCKELMDQRDYCKQLLISMVYETKETMQRAIEREHRKAECLFDGKNTGTDCLEFLSIANTELANLSETLVKVKALYHKFISKVRVCAWKRKFILEDTRTEFLTINDDDIPQFLRCNLKLAVNLPSSKEVNLIIQDLWAEFMRELKVNPRAKLVSFLRQYCEKRFEDNKERFLFAYNFYFGLKRDAINLDAGCVLNILHGEMMENTYAMMKQQCSNVLKMCTELDAATEDSIPKSQFLKILRELLFLKKQKNFDKLVKQLDIEFVSEIRYNQIFKLDAQCAARGFALELQQQVIEEHETFLDLCIRSLDAVDTFGTGLLKFIDFMRIFRIIDPVATPEHVETTVLKVMNLDNDSAAGVASTDKLPTDPFPIAQFIANLRLLPNLNCCTPFDLLKNIDEVKAAFHMDNS